MGPVTFGKIMASLGATLEWYRNDDRDIIHANNVGLRTRFLLTDPDCIKRRCGAAFSFDGFGARTNTAILAIRESGDPPEIHLYSYSSITRMPDDICLDTDREHDFMKKSLGDDVSIYDVIKWNIGLMENLAKLVGIRVEPVRRF